MKYSVLLAVYKNDDAKHLHRALTSINETLVYVRIGNGFHSKRGSKTRIKGWKRLQKYMLKNGLINRGEAFMNMVYIRLFTYCPAWLRKLVYDKILRR